MAHPYTNDEIHDITATVMDHLYQWLTTCSPAVDPILYAGWQDKDAMWEAWAMYGEKYSPLAKDRGLHREMLSDEQRALVWSMVIQTLRRAERTSP